MSASSTAFDLGDGAPLIILPPSAAASARAAVGRPANPNSADQVVKTPSYFRNVEGIQVQSANPRREYIARTNTGVFQNYKNYLAALPKATDDLDRQLGTDTIRRMMQDPQINSSLYLVALASMSRGLRIKPRITDKKNPAFAQAEKMQRFIEYNLAQLDNSFNEVIIDMIIGAMSAGNAVAEQTWALKEGGEWDGKLLLNSLKVKPPEVYAFLQDKYGNVPAIASFTGDGTFTHPLSTSPLFIPGRNVSNPELPFASLGLGWEAIPIGKFAVLTFRKRYNDPRGQSALRSAYGAWYLLMQIWPEYLKYLTQFASPAIVGTLPDKAQGEFNPNTGDIEDPLDVMYDELMNFSNGTVMALRFGSQVDLKWSQGEGTAFLAAINALNHQMVKAILHQTLATEESKNQGRAASSTHQDVLNIGVRGVKNSVVSMIQRQIFRPLIAMNFGENAAELLTPYCSLGDVATEDKGQMVSSYAAAGYSVGPTQFSAIDGELELEVRSAEQAAADYEAANPKPQAAATAPSKNKQTAKTKVKPRDPSNPQKPANPAKPKAMFAALSERLGNLERRFRKIDLDLEE